MDIAQKHHVRHLKHQLHIERKGPKINKINQLRSDSYMTVDLVQSAQSHKALRRVVKYIISASAS